MKSFGEHATSEGRYRIIRTRGEGGMASVQLALQLHAGGIQRLAAVKRVRPELAMREELIQMFMEEARITTGLSHPNIVQTYEVGRDAEGCFLAMEYLRGQSLEDVFGKIGFDAVDYGFALEVLLRTLTGLEYAHEFRDLSGRALKLVHRDISPSNLAITYDGQVKILDFGIAKAVGSPIQTEPGVIKGKVIYMAPEQMLHRKVDARADLYAVGVILWEVIAGRPRWEKSNTAAILRKFTAGTAAEPPGAARRGLPVLADEICLRALSLDVEKRYPSAAAFRADLLKLAAQSGGRRTTRQLGEYLSRLFVIERQREQKIIELALERASRDEELSRAVLGNGAGASPAIALDLAPRRASSGDVDASGSEPTRWATEDSMDTQALPAHDERPRRNHLAIVAGFAIVAAVAAPLWFLNSVQSSASEGKVAQSSALAAAPIESAMPSQDVPALSRAPSIVGSPQPPIEHAQDPARATNARTKPAGKRAIAGGARSPAGESSDGLSDRK
jgi:serine/threonine-protein kinase